MKRVLHTILLLGVLMGCFCISAMAAEGNGGIYGVRVESGYETLISLQPQTAEGADIAATMETINGVSVSGFYSQGVKLRVTYSGAEAAAQYLTLVLSDDAGIPTEGNIAYIDQDGAGGDGVSFTIYPSGLSSGKVYSIYLSSNAQSGITSLTKVASFQYHMPYKPGDVDEDGNVTATDALFTLQLSVGRPNTPQGQPWSENQRLAADVDSASGITGTDALYILEASVGKRKF